MFNNWFYLIQKPGWWGVLILTYWDRRSLEELSLSSLSLYCAAASWELCQDSISKPIIQIFRWSKRGGGELNILTHHTIHIRTIGEVWQNDRQTHRQTMEKTKNNLVLVTWATCSVFGMLKITLYEIQIQMWVHNLSLPASFEESVSINYVQLERRGVCGCSQMEKIVKN